MHGPNDQPLRRSGKIDDQAITHKNLQIIMGHSSIKVTMDIYAKAESMLIGVNRNALSEMLAVTAN